MRHGRRTGCPVPDTAPRARVTSSRARPGRSGEVLSRRRLSLWGGGGFVSHAMYGDFGNMTTNGLVHSWTQSPTSISCLVRSNASGRLRRSCVALFFRFLRGREGVNGVSYSKESILAAITTGPSDRVYKYLSVIAQERNECEIWCVKRGDGGEYQTTNFLMVKPIDLGNACHIRTRF